MGSPFLCASVRTAVHHFFFFFSPPFLFFFFFLGVSSSRSSSALTQHRLRRMRTEETGGRVRAEPASSSTLWPNGEDALAEVSAAWSASGHDGQLRPSGALWFFFTDGELKTCLQCVWTQLRAGLPASCFLRWIQLIVRRVCSAHLSLSLSLSLSLPPSLSPSLCPSSPPQNKECISSSSSVMALSHRSSPLPAHCRKYFVSLLTSFLHAMCALPAACPPCLISHLHFNQKKKKKKKSKEWVLKSDSQQKQATDLYCSCGSGCVRGSPGPHRDPAGPH